MTFKPLATLTALALSSAIGLGTVGTAQAQSWQPSFGVGSYVGGNQPLVDVQYRDRGERIFRRNQRVRRQTARRNERVRRRTARRNAAIREDRRYRRYRRNRNRAIVGGVVGGLALGAIIANRPRAYAPAPVYRAPRYRFSAAHHGWCSHRYRSYRAYDGTFQPYHGPRKLCRSPYL